MKRKKMNFTTELPKRDPLVSYIVASAVKCEKFFPGCNTDGPAFRMHAVILTQGTHKFGQFETPADSYNFVLCHVRKVNNHRDGFGLPLLSLWTRRSMTEDFSGQFWKFSESECDRKVSMLCSELKEDLKSEMNS